MKKELVFSAPVFLMLVGSAILRFFNPVSFGDLGWVIPLLIVGMYLTLLVADRCASKYRRSVKVKLKNGRRTLGDDQVTTNRKTP